MTFEETGLRPEILSAVADLGFETPSPIQEKSIPFLLSSEQDLIAFAQTGTGKTAAFGLPVLNQIDTSFNVTQAFVLCPTRELCLQISKDFGSYAKNIRGLKIASVYGGESIDKQIKALRKGAHVIVGTPGRVKDLINRGILHIEEIDWLVLDEADEMLSMGFKEDLDMILSGTPQEKRSLLFSATMPKELIRIANQYMNSPYEINLGTKNKSSENVEHHYYCVRNKDRYNALKRVLDVSEDAYAIVFCRTRYETKEVADLLIQDGYMADAIHGDLSQAQREQVLRRFRNKAIQFLVATDVAARGLDIDSLTHVINFNLPDQTETYIHRSGRTGRANKFGISIAVITDREVRRIKEIEKIMGKSMILQEVPDAKKIGHKKLELFVDKIVNAEADENNLAEYLPVVSEKLDHLSKEELVQKIVSLELTKILEYYKGSSDINVSANDRGGRDRGDRRSRGNNENFSRLFINLGKEQGLNAQRLMGLVNENLSGRSVEIGRIDIMKSFSFFEIDKSFDKQLIDNMDGEFFEGRRIGVEISKEKRGGGGRGGRRGGSDRRGGGDRGRRRRY